MPSLKLALAHLAIAHKQPADNRDALLALLRKAGEQGAQLVAAPELAVSGYSFADYRDMAPYAETADGPTLTAVADLCRTYGYFACIGLAERDAGTGILYNSAFVLGPDGGIVRRYRKINAEMRWACPGDPCQDNTFATPWGRIGILICSDSYHSLMPRVTALRGTDLLVIVANWPPTGLDPLEIWRARAMENGFAVAACNRTGQDLIMDCRQAPSALFDAQGDLLLQQQRPNSSLLWGELPLTEESRLPSGQRFERLATRRFADMHACYLNRSGIDDLTAFLQLPDPGPLHLRCHCLDTPRIPLESLSAPSPVADERASSLHLLPLRQYGDAELSAVHRWCAASRHMAVLCRTSGSGETLHWFDGADTWHAPNENRAVPFPSFDCGPARVCVLPGDALLHPEMVLACAKQGADLVLVFSRRFDATIRLLGGARTIEQTAVAVCSPEGGGIWMTPEGHQRWQEVLAQPGESCHLLLDTARTRRKRYQDRIDFATLLRDGAMARIP